MVKPNLCLSGRVAQFAISFHLSGVFADINDNRNYLNCNKFSEKINHVILEQ